MSEHQNIVIKYRLMGAIILLALGVIFIPLLLDGDGLKLEAFDNVVISLPEEPDYKKIPISSEQIKEKILQDYQDMEAKKQQSAIPETLATKSKKALKLTAWAIQVATYHSEKPALGFKNKLIGKKYSAYIEKFTKNEREFFKVKIGPLPNKQEADKMRIAIAKIFKVKPVVVSYP